MSFSTLTFMKSKPLIDSLLICHFCAHTIYIMDFILYKISHVQNALTSGKENVTNILMMVRQ
jgi:hypothetical protein